MSRQFEVRVIANGRKRDTVRVTAESSADALALALADAPPGPCVVFVKYRAPSVAKSFTLEVKP